MDILDIQIPQGIEGFGEKIISESSNHNPLFFGKRTRGRMISIIKTQWSPAIARSHQISTLRIINADSLIMALDAQNNINEQVNGYRCNQALNNNADYPEWWFIFHQNFIDGTVLRS
jgi:hypothetical protein